ncbi:MAG: hypothetical protein CL927_14770 [Deltaproteobacteria bacterium]|nr:hypothetical protein [Deltaproteobacteria bacterium]
MTDNRTSLEVSISRLLMVEDNPMDQAHLRRSLRDLSEGLEIRVAPTIGRALELLQTESFDIAMVDWQLPDGFGDKVLNAALELQPPVPVVMMTGGDVSDAELMLQNGAQDFVSKRAQPSEILRAVGYAVTRSRWDAYRKQTAMLTESRERSAAMTRLAAGVAHDLNNTLAVVSMNLELLSGLVAPLSGDAAECLSSAREAAQAAAERCAQLRTYTGSMEVKSHPVDLTETVSIALRQAGITREPDSSGLQGESATVRGDSEILDTLFSRLVAGVMELGEPLRPRLHVGRAPPQAGSQWILPETQNAPADLNIILPWRGRPVDIQDLRRRFDPFGEGAHGASLALGECVGFIRAHGGALAAHSSGTYGHFEIRFPRWNPGPAVHSGVSRRRTDGTTRVWVVDDEPLVLRVLVRVLQLRGMQVEAFSDGHEAYHAALDGQHCDLLITDLLMPGMGGAELIDRLRADGWTQPVIVITGYSDQVSSLSSTEDVCVLLKPFTNADLFDAIDAELGEDR